MDGRALLCCSRRTNSQPVFPRARSLTGPHGPWTHGSRPPSCKLAWRPAALQLPRIWPGACKHLEPLLVLACWDRARRVTVSLLVRTTVHHLTCVAKNNTEVVGSERKDPSSCDRRQVQSSIFSSCGFHPHPSTPPKKSQSHGQIPKPHTAAAAAAAGSGGGGPAPRGRLPRRRRRGAHNRSRSCILRHYRRRRHCCSVCSSIRWWR